MVIIAINIQKKGK